MRFRLAPLLVTLALGPLRAVRAGSFLRLLVVLPLLGVMGACVQIRPIRMDAVGSEPVFKKNYELRRKQVVHVGQPIIAVKEYMVTRIRAPRMRATTDFVIDQLGIVVVRGVANTDYPVQGELTVGETVYTVVTLPPGFWGQFGVLIAPDGRILNRLLNPNGVLSLGGYAVKPADVLFIPSFDEKIDTQAGYTNFELLYGGTDGKSLFITYREYTSEDIIRPAFTQNLVYEARSPSIRFRNARIEIHEATGERLVYTVVADDLK